VATGTISGHGNQCETAVPVDSVYFSGSGKANRLSFNQR